MYSIMEEKKKFSNPQNVIEIIIGLVGATLCYATNISWAIIPIILYGIMSVFLIRRFNIKNYSEDAKLILRKRNLISLICGLVVAVACYFTLHENMYENGLWLILSAYLFLLIHGIIMVLPIEKNK